METGYATPVPDLMGAPLSFTARMPNASVLPTLELPPPPLSSMKHRKYQNSETSSSSAVSTKLGSSGTLFTPPSHALSSASSALSNDASGSFGSWSTADSKQHGTWPRPNSSSEMWPPPSTGTYGFQSSNNPHQSFGSGRGLFSPSLNSIMRANDSGNEFPLPHHQLPQQSASVPMATSSLPEVTQKRQSVASQPSPVRSQEAFAKSPPTPLYYNNTLPPSAAPQRGSLSYSSGPSPVQQHPFSAHSLTNTSPVNGGVGPVPSPQHASQTDKRPYFYPLPGPVLSNIGNPNGHLQIIGGTPYGVVSGFNSGHALQMQKLYGHPKHIIAPIDRPFKCEKCAQSFNRSHDLKRHNRIHLAVKPFPCGHCDKSFSRKDALKRHMLVKGCGKGTSTAEVREIDGSLSPWNRPWSPKCPTMLPPNLAADRTASVATGSSSSITSKSITTPKVSELRDPAERVSSVLPATLLAPHRGSASIDRDAVSESPPPDEGYITGQSSFNPISSDLANKQFESGNSKLSESVSNYDSDIEGENEAFQISKGVPTRNNESRGAKAPPTSTDTFATLAPHCTGAELEGGTPPEHTSLARVIDEEILPIDGSSVSADGIDVATSETTETSTDPSVSPSSSNLKDEIQSELTLEGSCEPDVPNASSSLRSQHCTLGPRIEKYSLHRLDRILQHLDELMDELSVCANVPDADSYNESQASSTEASCDDSRSTEAFDITCDDSPNALNDNANDTTHTTTAPPPSAESSRGDSQSSGSFDSLKRSWCSNGQEGSDGADDGSRKRSRRSGDSHLSDLNAPEVDLRDQIPCLVDDCSGKDTHISEMIRKCAKHHSFFVCTRCYLQIEDKQKLGHHRATSEGCEPHCISSSCAVDPDMTNSLSVLSRRHKRKYECPTDKKASVQDRWQYLHSLRYPDRPVVSPVFQPGPSHPHGSGRPKTQRKQATKAPSLEEFRQQLAEARNEIQNLRTQQSFDETMLEVNAKQHSEKVFRLELVIAACIEAIPRIPGSLQRMLEVDAPGALKMIEKSSVAMQPQCMQQPAALPPTPQYLPDPGWNPELLDFEQ